MASFAPSTVNDLAAIYAIRVIGGHGEIEGEIEIECGSDQEAANIAFGAASLFGHQLWRDGRCLGWFGDSGPPLRPCR